YQICVFFFFQAEDGIRDFHVTGVQTCALPIYAPEAVPVWSDDERVRGWLSAHGYVLDETDGLWIARHLDDRVRRHLERGGRALRSEERRVGKEGRSWCEPAPKKK